MNTETSDMTTSMRCLWTNTDHSACHFRNLYFDLEKQRFAYFGPHPRSEEWQFPENTTVTVTSPSSGKEEVVVHMKNVRPARNQDG
jgi:hypothetical protein